MFKVGDWVVSKHTGEVCLCEKIDGDDFYSNENKWHITTSYSSWQPKEGEWCWFYDSEYPLSYILCKFETFDNGFWCRPNFSDTMERFNGCEPFIDELPSFLKENR